MAEDVIEELDAGSAEAAHLSGVRAALLGSVSYGVVHHSSRPLLVVPPD